ncbi:hypothetical protein J2Z62_000597 [Mycoplasmoides fastidiosum]|uniref:TM2 domain-containing protein n=1 Tax=Mycoplasmoides fastidiosum TaxID=92758 RepID=A0ABU0LZN8_9BACT|nr:TM2 domain-containing protein [Mycoplasmoides fastidiosum]MDQ0514159.1 hypothetical protein [Mycoplasmoides fastidiosum]UUD37433.1 NINE protein [Mycoplasmoides fastidiosum]
MTDTNKNLPINDQEDSSNQKNEINPTDQSEPKTVVEPTVQPKQIVNDTRPLNSTQALEQVSSKSFIVTLLLAIFLPGFDRFYSGKIFLGILKLFTGAGFGLWWLIDLVLLVTSSYRDGNGLVIKPL